MARELPTNYYSWDPLEYNHEPSLQSVLRVQKDIAEFHAGPPTGIFISPEETNITRIHVLMVGSAGTPYEGGFFQFLIRCPPDYPLNPPRMRFMTTDAGRVRFNIHLYNSGKVCVSTLGTAPGPGWSPVHGLVSVLVSVQSLMGEHPYFNMFQQEKQAGDSDKYDEFVRHETLRVAVCGQVEAALKDDPSCPPAFRKRILDSFLESYDKYEDIAKSRLHLTGTEMKDACSFRSPGTFQYEALLTRLKDLKEGVEKKNEAAAAEAAAKAAAEAAAQTVA